MTNDAGNTEEDPTLAGPPATEGAPGAAPPEEAAELRPKDEGDVPAKQIHRWKNEGGAYLPAD